MDRVDRTGSGLEDLFKASYARLVTSVYAFTGDLSEAQDAVQEAFARAAAKQAQVLGADSPEAYVFTIARNIARRHWRRERRLAERLRLEQARVDGPLPPSPDRVALVRALGKLPEAQRDALVRFHFADQSVEEIASAAGVPVGTVKARLSRGRAALHAMIDETVDDLRPDVAGTVDGVRQDVAAAAGSPDLSAAFRRGRQRQVRRRAGFAGGAAVIAAAASILVLLGFVPARLLPSHQLDGVVVSATGAVQMPTIMAVDAKRFFGLVLLKDRHWALANSTDGGQRWTTLRLPDAVNRWAGGVYEPVLLAPRTVLLGSYLTRDAGRTWALGPSPTGSPSWPANRVAPPALKLGTPLTSVPAGWPLTVACHEMCDPVAVNPADGVHHVLRNLPVHNIDGDPDVGVHNGNSLWVKQRDGVVYSLDGGLTWSTRTPSRRTMSSFTLAVNGRYVYLVIETYDGRNAPVVRSLDGGRTWQTVTSDAVTPQGGSCALPDGTLLAVGLNGGADTKLLASRDHGSSFRVADPRIHPGRIHRALDGTCVMATGSSFWVADSASAFHQLRLLASPGSIIK